MSAATLTRGPEVLASKTGPCPHCETLILGGGHYIAKVDGSGLGWMHAECAAAYVRDREQARKVRAEHETDGAQGAGEETT